MSTKHVILALLDIQPMSGYDLAQNIKISTQSLWAASYSQIYPTLHKLEEEGAVTSSTTSSEKGGERILYALTEIGRKSLEAWMHQPVQYLPFRDPFKLWASYLDRIAPAVVQKMIEQHIRLHQERAESLETIVKQIENGFHPLIQLRANSTDAEQFERLKKTRAFIFRELATQAREEIAFAHRLRQFSLELNQ